MSETQDNLEAIFDAALELAAEERPAYLSQACAGNEALRRQVERLLRNLSRAGRFLTQCEKVASEPASAVLEKPGAKIGRYKLLQQIGEGGCGVVYMAEQESPIRRRVALKIIKLGMDTRSVIARFEAARQALALMDHTNIAKVHDAGATETGRPYFVMELVRGTKITDYCDEKNLSTQQRLNLFMKICQAIQHAHQKGIIHRDVKPSNVLVTVNDGVPVPKVIDFGIAKATTDQRLTDKTVFTAFEQFIGTPAYMSPEQAETTSVDVDTRSDIYSLGVLLYELLTGKTPFDAKELLQAGIDEMRRTIREKEPDRPSTRVSTLHGEELTTTAKRRGLDAPKLISVLRGDLDWIVMKCLEKDRARRYETANGLASDIQRHLKNEPVVACPPSNIYRFQKLVRRNKLAFAAATAVTAALIIGLGVSTWMFVRERQAKREQVRLRQDADSARQQSQTAASRAEQVAQFLKDMLKGVGPSKALGRDTTMLREILDQTAEGVGKDLKNQPEVEGDLRSILAGVYEELGLYEKAERMNREALALTKKCFGDEHPYVAKELNNLGIVLWRVGKLAEAESTHREALAMRRRLLDQEHPDVANSLGNLALVLKDQSKLAEAEALFREELAIERKLLGNESRAVPGSLSNLALLLQAEGRLSEAESMHREALALAKKLYPSEHPTVAICLVNLGSVLRDEGKLAEAETLLRQAVALAKKLYGDEHAVVAAFLANLGGVLRFQGKLVEAEALSRQSLAIRRKALTDKHPAVADSLNELAEVLRARGNLVEAENKRREALAIQQTLFGDEHPIVGQSLFGLGRTLRDEGKLAEAETTLRDALAATKKTRGNEHADIAEILNSLACTLRDQGNLPEAESMLSDALERKQRDAGARGIEVCRDNLVDVLVREGKFEVAERLVNQFLAVETDGKPLSTDALRARAGTLALIGRWREAANDLSRAIELNPDDEEAWHLLTAILVETGNFDAYREHCRQVLERFGKTTAPVTAQRVAIDCLILPASGVDLAAVSELAETAVKLRGEPWDAFCKGLSEYRQGRFANAAEWMQKVPSDLPAGARRLISLDAHMVQAMAHHQLKQTDQARVALAEGLKLAEDKLPKGPDGYVGRYWNDAMYSLALLREAKALIEGQTTPRANEREETIKSHEK